MSVTFNILKKASIANLYSDIRRYFVKQRELGSDIRRYIVKQRELGLFRLIAESRILQYCFFQQFYEYLMYVLCI